MNKLFKPLLTVIAVAFYGWLIYDALEKAFGPGDPLVPVALLIIITIGSAIYGLLLDNSKSLAELKLAAIALIQQERNHAETQKDMYEQAAFLNELLVTLTGPTAKNKSRSK